MSSKVIMLFLDGVGIGENNHEFNPFFKYEFRTFTNFFGAIPHLSFQYLSRSNRFLFPVDAHLGVKGLPQSGTGQTAIFCGFNASEFIGKHFGPFAYSTLIPRIQTENIFNILQEKEKKVCFANAYPKPFFKYLKSGRKILNVTALMVQSSIKKFNRSTDVHKGNALTAELTNSRWNAKLKYKLPVITPKKAALNLLRLAKNHDFTLFEFFYTDYIGHYRYDGGPEEIITRLDEFLFTIFDNLPDDTTLIISSDHGNCEDLSHKSHTHNPALGIIAGNNAEEFQSSIRNLMDYKKVILDILC